MEAVLTPKQIIQSSRGEIIGAYLRGDRLHVFFKGLGEYNFDLDEFDCRITELHMDKKHLMCNDVSLNQKLFSLLEETGMRNV